MNLINLLLTIFFFILILGLLIFVHELGHFLAAKLTGVDVKEFALGFGKTLFRKHYKGTDYVINMLPIGGYVNLEGETKVEGPNSFRNKPIWVKSVVLLAGVFMNTILAIILLTIYLNNNGFRFVVPNIIDYSFTQVENQRSLFPMSITSIQENGSAFGHLEVGDVIVGISDVNFQSYPEFTKVLKESQGKEVKFELINFDTYETTTKTFTVGFENEKGVILGAGLRYDDQLNRPAYFIKYKNTPLAGASMTFDMFIYQAKGIISLISGALQTGNYQEVAKNVGGPLAVANQVGEVVSYQILDFLIPLTALISISLAFFNVLPFPALDGGQLAIYIIESITRRKVSDEFIQRINMVGFSILIILAILITFKDLVQLNIFENILNFIRNVLGR